MHALFVLLEAVDQNPFLRFSQKVLIIEAICCKRSITCVSFSLRKCENVYFYSLVCSTLQDVNKNNIKITALRIADGV